MQAEVHVIGGGISGLSVAALLAADRESGPPLAVEVLEAGERVGGVCWSELDAGRVLDLGPSSWLSGEPALDRLIRLAGLEESVLDPSPAAKARWIWADGRRHAVPASPPALLRTQLIPWAARLRLLAEPLVGRGDPEAEESVAEFVARRLGPGMVDRMVAPMVAGIYGSDPKELSLKAAFPKLWQLEADHRSLLIGAMRSRGGPRPHLQALRGGAGTLSRGLADLLAEHIHTGTKVAAIEPEADGFRLHTDKGERFARAVVLALPPRAQAAVLRGMDAGAAHALDEMTAAPLAVCTTAWPADAWPQSPQGFGVLVAGDSRDVGVLGTIFVSTVFPEHAPEGEILLRTMIGGTPDPGALDLDDQQLAARAHAAEARFLGTPAAAPLSVHIVRHPRAIPIYAPGHLRRVAVARQAQARHPGLFLAGPHLDGPGLRDRARQGLETAAAVRRWVLDGVTEAGVEL